MRASGHARCCVRARAYSASLVGGKTQRLAGGKTHQQGTARRVRVRASPVIGPALARLYLAEGSAAQFHVCAATQSMFVCLRRLSRTIHACVATQSVFVWLSLLSHTIPCLCSRIIHVCVLIRLSRTIHACVAAQSVLVWLRRLSRPIHVGMFAGGGGGGTALLAEAAAPRSSSAVVIVATSRWSRTRRGPAARAHPPAGGARGPRRPRPARDHEKCQLLLAVSTSSCSGPLATLKRGATGPRRPRPARGERRRRRGRPAGAEREARVRSQKATDEERVRAHARADRCALGARGNARRESVSTRFDLS